MTLILINEPRTLQSTDAPPTDLASLGIEPNDALVELFSPEIAPSFDDSQPVDPKAANAATPASDGALRALLFGRYVGQMQARIERAWLRPRSPIGASSFDCRVQIVQDRSGRVKQTTLQACNGTQAWQLSLVQGIQNASPLPAPPDPRVFADAVVLTFHARAYVSGASTDGFEPPPLAAGHIVPAVQIHRADDGSIDLTITGSPSQRGLPRSPPVVTGAALPAPLVPNSQVAP